MSLTEAQAEYQRYCRLAATGDRREAGRGLLRLLTVVSDADLLARIHNDLGVLASLNAEVFNARTQFEKAIEFAPRWPVPQENLRRLGPREISSSLGAPSRVQRVAIVSLLFNWPSTGGGTVHTAETGKFLADAGYEVRHFYAEFPDWGLGKVTEPPLAPSEPLRFDASEWTVENIKARFRSAVEAFDPDWVIVTDSWNSKPILAEAVSGYRYLLRIAAQECLCPLNNVRLLVNQGRFTSCPKHQFATPADCSQCVQQNGQYSGGLHQAERELVQYGSLEYDQSLRSAFASAEAVLVVNPLIGAMIGPYAKKVCVVPSGFDPARFASPSPAPCQDNGRVQILFAGLVNEPMKGFEVLLEACQELWKKRHDFELLATADPVGQVDAFTRFIGWQSQAALPTAMDNADIIVVPTVAEEALGRTAVEAMGAGRPVIASKIGGLQFTVADGSTGLLFAPGDSQHLQQQLERLIDDPELRKRLGRSGRQRFEQEFTWDSIIRKHYAPLLGPAMQPIASLANDVGNSSVGQALEPQNVVLGCVLAVQNRPMDVLERTLQTYAFQTVSAADYLLVDYGSRPELSIEYRRLCQQYGWRLLRVQPDDPAWSLSTAYNLAVSALTPNVNVVFKGDVDVMLGENVLETAAAAGRNHLCIFSCQTTVEGTQYPASLPDHQTFSEWLRDSVEVVSMDGEGIHAYPRHWFEEIGGFDRQYGTTWGYEDSDLRLRASWSIGVTHITGPILIHQWHLRPTPQNANRSNYEYYQSTKPLQKVIRNESSLLPIDLTYEEVAFDSVTN